MGKKRKAESLDDYETIDMVEENDSSDHKDSTSLEKAREHVEQLERLKEKDPEFYEFLKEHDKELLEFNAEEIDDDGETGTVEDEMQDLDDVHDQDRQLWPTARKEEKPSKGAITTAMVDSWCNSILENGKISALRSLLKAFRMACHYGDDDNDSSAKLHVISSNVFNRIMSFVLSEMDGILRNMMKLPSSGGKKEMIMDLKNTKQWKKYNHLVKSYLGNSLHVLNQMTDTQMIAFTLRRLKYSSLFLAAFPSLLRKYVKVALHFWGTGGGALPVVSLLFLRDLCIRLGSDCLDECFRGIYKAYVLSSQFVNATRLQHINFLSNCVIELFGVDLATAYQHGFIFIRQLAMILRDALSMKTKEAFRKVYEWKYINCLELWTGAICAYCSEADFRPLAYPLTQIISGVARLVPTARYFPLRLRCARMLNRIAASTSTFIPVSMLLLDMLEMKELNRPPTGGVGNAVDLHTVLKVSKPTVKTRSFQEACVLSVVEELAEHLAQWSYSVAFFELSFIPAVRLRSFCKSTKIERFQREMKHLIHQIEANSQFTNEKRTSVSFLPNDPAAACFLEDEKRSGASPLSKYVATLRVRAQQRSDSLRESSVLVGAQSSVFGKEIAESDEANGARNEEGEAVFSSSWLPGKDSRAKHSEGEKKKKKKLQQQQEGPLDEDIVEDLVLSSDEDGSMSDLSSRRQNAEGKELSRKQQNQHQLAKAVSNKKTKIAKKAKKRKRTI
ncbi:Nucleolar Complex 2 protein [Ancistrocladus abbreviatus]